MEGSAAPAKTERRAINPGAKPRAAAAKNSEEKVKTMKFASRYTCASLLVFGALAASTASAEIRELATVTFNQPVAVGTATLPAGHYHINAAGSDAFLIQSDNGDKAAIVLGTRADITNAEAAKTHVVLENDGEGLRLDKLVIAGNGTSYDFAK